MDGRLCEQQVGHSWRRNEATRGVPRQQDMQNWRDLNNSVRREREKKEAKAPKAPNEKAIHSQRPRTDTDTGPRLSGMDLAIGAIVWLAAWLILWRTTAIGGGGAAALAIIPGGIAAKWWRQLFFVAIAGGAIWFFFLHHSK